MLASEPKPPVLGLTASQFLALSVKDLAASARWQQQTFALSVLKDLPSPDGSSHTRILHSPVLVVELSHRELGGCTHSNLPGPTASSKPASS